jgi:hypothetical protein
MNRQIKRITDAVRHRIASGSEYLILRFRRFTLHRELLNILKLPVGWFRRHSVVFLTSDAPEIVEYYVANRKKVVVMSVQKTDERRRRKLWRSVPEVQVVVGWNKYLAKDIEIANLGARELHKAIPYQLSLLSPF